MMVNFKRRFALLGILLATTVLSGCSYNRFVSQEEAVKAQWAQVQNQLQRRNDLIPNLVETVKGYAEHEQEVFQQIAESRAKLSGARWTWAQRPSSLSTTTQAAIAAQAGKTLP